MVNIVVRQDFGQGQTSKAKATKFGLKTKAKD